MNTPEFSIHDDMELRRKDLAEEAEKLAAPEVYCIDCKHLLGRRMSPENFLSWKCAAKQNTKSERRNLVSGQIITERIAEGCCEARVHPEGCGPEGKWYEKYEYPTDLYQHEDIDPKSGSMTIESRPALSPAAQLARARAASRSRTRLTNDDLENL